MNVARHFHFRLAIPLSQCFGHQSPGRRRRRHRSGNPSAAVELLESRCLPSATLPALTVSNTSVLEGNTSQQTGTVQVALNRPSSVPVTVAYATRNKSAIAGFDYQAQSGVLTIPAGQTTLPLSFRVLADTIDEPSESFEIVLSVPANAIISHGIGTVTIRDDDPLPVIQVADVKVTEGRAGAVSVSLSNASSLPVTVSFQTTGATATAGTDFLSASGVLTIPAGSTAASVAVQTNGDVRDEPDEAFRLVFSNPGNARLGDVRCIVTIRDDDGTQLPLFQLSDMAYLGAFRVPQGVVGSSTFEYGGNSLAWNPDRNSLFTTSNFDNGLNIAEIRIPTQLNSTGSLAGMTVATVLQPFVNLGGLLTVDAGGRSTSPVFGYENLRIGGLLIAGGSLTGGMFMGYNGAEPENSTHSHFRAAGLNLSALNSSTLTGLVDIRRRSDIESGRVRGGYMAEVPRQWRPWIGASFVTGAAAQNRIQFSSSGPALFGFDALDPQASSGSPLVNYPFGHALQWKDAPSIIPQPIFNGTTSIVGVAFVPGTRSVIFLGSNGLSAIGYGVGSRFNDHARPYSGFHSQNGNYQYQIWAYDIDDFMSVRNGTLNAWDVRPTSVVNFNLPTPEPAKYLGGTAFDAATGRLYVSQKLAGPAATPIIHVYQLGRTATGALAAVSSSSSGASAPSIALNPALAESAGTTLVRVSAAPVVPRTFNTRQNAATARGNTAAAQTSTQNELPALMSPQSGLTAIDSLFESIALSLVAW